VEEGFASKRTRPIELGGEQGTREVTEQLVAIVESLPVPAPGAAA